MLPAIFGCAAIGVFTCPANKTASSRQRSACSSGKPTDARIRTLADRPMLIADSIFGRSRPSFFVFSV